jgi:hypothetical protein
MVNEYKGDNEVVRKMLDELEAKVWKTDWEPDWIYDIVTNNLWHSMAAMGRILDPVDQVRIIV